MFTTRTITTAALTAGLAFTAMTASADAARTSYAATPSGNIVCKAQRTSGWNLVCNVRSAGRTFRISADGEAYESGYRSLYGRGRTMNYGGVYYIGPFLCQSSEEGLGCVDPNTDAGLWLSRDASAYTN